jgi:hypothetical protein
MRLIVELISFFRWIYRWYTFPVILFVIILEIL